MADNQRSNLLSHNCIIKGFKRVCLAHLATVAIEALAISGTFLRLTSSQRVLRGFNPKPASPNFYSLTQEVQAETAEAAAANDKSTPRPMALVPDAQWNRYIQNWAHERSLRGAVAKYPYKFKIR